MSEIVIKERPLPFKPEMVKATIDGIKTMTRRTRGLKLINENPDDWEAIYFSTKLKRWVAECDSNDGAHLERINCPYGEVGDLLYVRENFAQVAAQYSSSDDGDSFVLSKRPIYHFLADGPLTVKGKNDWNIEAGKVCEKGFCPYEGELFWHRRPSIHMPKDISRIWLRIKDIRVERAHDVSTEDIKAEGVRIRTGEGGRLKFELGLNSAMSFLPQDVTEWSEEQLYFAHFAELWSCINGRSNWELNPWVWVISYEVLSTTGKPLNLYESK